jgi:hypothetical protein
MGNKEIKEKVEKFADYMGRYLKDNPTAIEYLKDIVETSYNAGFSDGHERGFKDGCYFTLR